MPAGWRCSVLRRPDERQRRVVLKRLAFALAIGLYVIAKIAELNDRLLFDLTGWISGHTIKHLLATAAAAIIVWGLVRSRSSTDRAAASPRHVVT